MANSVSSFPSIQAFRNIETLSNLEKDTYKNTISSKAQLFQQLKEWGLVDGLGNPTFPYTTIGIPLPKASYERFHQVISKRIEVCNKHGASLFQIPLWQLIHQFQAILKTTFNIHVDTFIRGSTAAYIIDYPQRFMAMIQYGCHLKELPFEKIAPLLVQYITEWEQKICPDDIDIIHVLDKKNLTPLELQQIKKLKIQFLHELCEKKFSSADLEDQGFMQLFFPSAKSTNAPKFVLSSLGDPTHKSLSPSIDHVVTIPSEKMGLFAFNAFCIPLTPFIDKKGETPKKNLPIFASCFHYNFERVATNATLNTLVIEPWHRQNGVILTTAEQYAYQGYEVLDLENSLSQELVAFWSQQNPKMPFEHIDVIVKRLKFHQIDPIGFILYMMANMSKKKEISADWIEESWKIALISLEKALPFLKSKGPFFDHVFPLLQGKPYREGLGVVFEWGLAVALGYRQEGFPQVECREDALVFKIRNEHFSIHLHDIHLSPLSRTRLKPFSMTESLPKVAEVYASLSLPIVEKLNPEEHFFLVLLNLHHHSQFNRHYLKWLEVLFNPSFSSEEKNHFISAISKWFPIKNTQTSVEWMKIFFYSPLIGSLGELWLKAREGFTRDERKDCLDLLPKLLERKTQAVREILTHEHSNLSLDQKRRFEIALTHLSEADRDSFIKDFNFEDVSIEGVKKKGIETVSQALSKNLGKNAFEALCDYHRQFGSHPQFNTFLLAIVKWHVEHEPLSKIEVFLKTPVLQLYWTGPIQKIFLGYFDQLIDKNLDLATHSRLLKTILSWPQDSTSVSRYLENFYKRFEEASPQELPLGIELGYEQFVHCDQTELQQWLHRLANSWQSNPWKQGEVKKFVTQKGPEFFKKSLTHPSLTFQWLRLFDLYGITLPKIENPKLAIEALTISSIFTKDEWHKSHQIYLYLKRATLFENQPLLKLEVLKVLLSTLRLFSIESQWLPLLKEVTEILKSEILPLDQWIDVVHQIFYEEQLLLFLEWTLQIPEKYKEFIQTKVFEELKKKVTILPLPDTLEIFYQLAKKNLLSFTQLNSLFKIILSTASAPLERVCESIFVKILGHFFPKRHELYSLWFLLSQESKDSCIEILWGKRTIHFPASIFKKIYQSHFHKSLKLETRIEMCEEDSFLKKALQDDRLIQEFVEENILKILTMLQGVKQNSQQTYLMRVKKILGELPTFKRESEIYALAIPLFSRASDESLRKMALSYLYKMSSGAKEPAKLRPLYTGLLERLYDHPVVINEQEFLQLVSTITPSLGREEKILTLKFLCTKFSDTLFPLFANLLTDLIKEEEHLDSLLLSNSLSKLCTLSSLEALERGEELLNFPNVRKNLVTGKLVKLKSDLLMQIFKVCPPSKLETVFTKFASLVESYGFFKADSLWSVVYESLAKYFQGAAMEPYFQVQTLLFNVLLVSSQVQEHGTEMISEEDREKIIQKVAPKFYMNLLNEIRKLPKCQGRKIKFLECIHQMALIGLSHNHDLSHYRELIHESVYFAVSLPRNCAGHDTLEMASDLHTIFKNIPPLTPQDQIEKMIEQSILLSVSEFLIEKKHVFLLKRALAKLLDHPIQEAHSTVCGLFQLVLRGQIHVSEKTLEEIFYLILKSHDLLCLNRDLYPIDAALKHIFVLLKEHCMITKIKNPREVSGIKRIFMKTLDSLRTLTQNSDLSNVGNEVNTIHEIFDFGIHEEWITLKEKLSFIENLIPKTTPIFAVDVGILHDKIYFQLTYHYLSTENRDYKEKIIELLVLWIEKNREAGIPGLMHIQKMKFDLRLKKITHPKLDQVFKPVPLDYR